MQMVKQWLIVNAFILLLFIGGSSASFVFGLALDLVHDPAHAAYGSAALSVAVLVLAYRIGKRIHARLQRTL